jgi:site-specific recombinase XerD
MSAANLKTVESRDKLKPQREPYYSMIKSGCYLGFRKMTPTSVGTWVARCRSAVTGKQLKTSLGDFEQLPKAQRYDAAAQEADRWFSSVGVSGTTEVKTVKDACDAYAKHIEQGDGDATKNKDKSKDFRARIARHVLSHKIASTALSKLNMEMVESWRMHLAQKPVVINPKAKPADQRTKPRTASALNRDMTALRAALNYAHKRGHVATDAAWLGPLSSIGGADSARRVYLTREERRKLLDVIQKDLRPFVETLCLLPLRPGAVAALKVDSFECHQGVLMIGKDKSGGDRKIKLPASTAEFFKASCANKPAGSVIFTRENGKAWNKDAWKKPFKTAATQASLSGRATTYSLRHTAITDLVPHLDLLTVAQISGTSVQMIQKHYGHLRQDRAVDALATLAI